MLKKISDSKLILVERWIDDFNGNLQCAYMHMEDG
jgi:hypothetical protein